MALSWLNNLISYQILQEAYTRCVSVLTEETTKNDIKTQVSTHITRCYSVAAQFEQCREKITELPNIVSDLCRILYFAKVRLCLFKS